ncbi:sporulation protein YqfD [Pullulanibacillus sp. KACC 23026]|uniref:sporulation protein YqfD n=1 Tax=Pullulanibacillus sp. KACC 23026 TaxID=3028315 RepID=UPI0023AFCA14|nr:sporulation protein YqfD [Pullulanibacillus sp. KACC 23026]WEG14234.1 sporulation protein YqfD [Pullulanibacillus sp. KACC 23026]
MKTKNWSENLQGHVIATVRGRLVEPFINRCIREQIRIWDIKRIEEDRIQCSILLSDIKRIKPILKQTDCRIHFDERVGLPFWTRRLLGRFGMIGGFILFFFIIFFMSNMVWQIDIHGADPVLEDEIRTILAKQDIHVGAIEFLLPSLGEIEDQLNSQLKETTWVGVSRDGTTYRVDVVQKELPKKEKEIGPRDLIASKTATIKKVYAEQGQAVVQQNDVVKKGQLLISGMMGDEAHHKFVPAKGTVLGETWYTSNTEVPLNTSYHTYTGRTYTKRQIKVWSLTIPIWGFNAKPFQKQVTETVTHPFHFLLWDIPIKFQTVTIREASQLKNRLTKDQAKKMGEELARQQLTRELSSDAKILSAKIQKDKVEKGVMHLQVFFTVEENIAKPRPFSPKDRQKDLKEKMDKQEQGN